MGGAPPDTFQVHERRPWGQGQILLYTVECPPTPPFNVSHLMVGYAYVEFAYGTWVGIGTAGSLINPEPVPLVHVQRGRVTTFSGGEFPLRLDRAFS